MAIQKPSHIADVGMKIVNCVTHFERHEIDISELTDDVDPFLKNKTHGLQCVYNERLLFFGRYACVPFHSLCIVIRKHGDLKEV